VRYLCDRVMVMHRGKLIESGVTEELWAAPATDYARALLARGATRGLADADEVAQA